MGNRLLITLGGNAIKQAHEEGTIEQQFKNVETICKEIVNIIKTRNDNYEVAITHGNGPHVGNLLVQQEEGSKLVPPLSLDVLGAMTQGQIGYMFQQILQNYLKAMGGRFAKIPVISVVNQVLVDRDDPEFLDPTKPVGDFFTKEEAEMLAKEKGYVMDPPAGKDYLEKKMRGFVIKQVKPIGSTSRPFRRVVPSPDPIRNVEGEVIKMLVDHGVMVVASGGGGIPVVMNWEGDLEGMFAVIDKDKAGERMAEDINATDFLILTDVEYAMLNFGKPNQRPVHEMSVEEAEKYLAEGHFLKGSMGPKVEACIRFLKWGGERAIISSSKNVIDALEGKTGTHILK